MNTMSPPLHRQCRSEILPLVKKGQKSAPKKSFSIIIKESRVLTRKEREILRNQLKSGGEISIDTFAMLAGGHQMGCAPEMVTEVIFWEK